MFLLIRQSVVSTLMLALVLCAVYPLAMTGIGNAVFPHKVSGSLVLKDGKVTGSELVGQVFTGTTYFHSRPSAAGEHGYDAGASSGSNLGPISQVLADRMTSTATGLRAEQGKTTATPIPVDLLTTSGSGLDPHLSPEGALFQAGRVALARGIPVEQIEALIARCTDGPEFGLFGEPRVNVLRLNMALDAQK